MNKLFYQCPDFNTFKTLKFATNSTNSDYITYNDNTVAIVGTPDIKWNQICFVLDDENPFIYINGRIIYDSEDILNKINNLTILSSNYEMSSYSNSYLSLEAGDTYEEAFGKIEKAIISNELITSTALIDLDNKITIADWNENDSTSYAYILNKPDLSNFLTSQIQSDWNEDDNTSAAYILNKPTIPTDYIIDYSKQYLTCVALEDGTISFNILKSMGTEYITSISYSTDNGKTWTTTNNMNNKEEHLSISVNVNEGDKVMWKGYAQQTGYYDEDDYGDYVGSFFSSTAEFDVQGNVMSLLYGDDFKGEDTLEYDGQFANLFYDYDGENECKVVNARNLSLLATTLTDWCYYRMFSDCTMLTTAPQLQSTTLASNCYYSMFDSCTALTTTSQLPATTLAESCYNSMFDGCTSLTTAPELPAATLANACYRHMFSGCASLTSAPELPATTLQSSCYYSMFKGCTNLTTAPELHATTLATSCYSNMFYGCTSLTTAPVLPATTLVSNCYNSMFYGCTNLNSITCLATDISATNCTANWVLNVAANGIFVKANSMNNWTTGNCGIPISWTVYTDEEYEIVRHYELSSELNKYKLEKDYSKEYLTFIALESGTISFTLLSWADTSYVETIAYFKNDGEWVEIQNSDNREDDIVISINVVEGDIIRWKGIANHIGDDGDNGGIFTSTCRFNAQGNIMSLLYGDNFQRQTTIEDEFAFSYLFNDVNNGTRCYIVDASNLILPATTLAQSCYQSMFKNCTSLTSAPQLPATTLAINCYSDMFYGCTSLTTAPELPATTLASNCYVGMFYNCTSLTSAPQLPATTLAEFCYYYMFFGCTNLTTAPELPATTVTQSCYSGMFSGCTNLNYIKAMFTTTPSSSYTQNWVYGVAASGTFVKNSAATWTTTGDDGIPSGWTVYTDEEYEIVRHYELPDEQIQADWNQTITTAKDYIKNKPDLSNFLTIETQANWNETNTSSAAYIQNKPIIPNDSNLFHKISNDDWNYVDDRWFAVSNIRIDNGDIRGRLQISDEYDGEIYLNDEYNNRWKMIKGNWGETLQQALDARNNVQADWNQITTTAVDYIKNKPIIPTVSTTVTQNDTNPVSGGAVYNKFEDLIGTAPAALDTLGEIAYALNNDANLAATLTNQISSKVPKVSNPTTDNFASFNSDGTIKDSSYSASSFIKSIKTINNESLVGTGNLVISGLPQVSASDNGKILMVVNGQWQLVSPSVLYSGSGIPNNANGNNGDLFIQTE
ncbi:leucine-rich repeat protein [bacterium]|nr:leucine-rich repeat protein [bacterium]